MTVSGLLGSLTCSPIVARTRRYKLVSVVVVGISALGTFLFAFLLTLRSRIITSACVFLIGYGMMPILALMMELACEVTYPVGEAMTSGLLIVGGQVIGISGVFVVDALLFYPLLANLVIAVCMGIAAVTALFIKETLVRTAKDRVATEDATTDLLEDQQPGANKPSIRLE